MDKLYASKAFLKMGGGRMYTPHPSPLDPPLAISYRNHQKSLAYFSHLAPSISFFFTERQRQKGVMTQYPLNALLPGSLRLGLRSHLRITRFHNLVSYLVTKLLAFTHA